MQEGNSQSTKLVQLSFPLVDATLQYLAQRPYLEVQGLIMAISNELRPQVSQPTPPTSAE